MKKLVLNGINSDGYILKQVLACKCGYCVWKCKIRTIKLDSMKGKNNFKNIHSGSQGKTLKANCVTTMERVNDTERVNGYVLGTTLFKN